jgi:prophage regulatory protein
MRLIRLPELKMKTGLSRSTIHLLSSKDLFPRSRKIGHRAVAWIETEVDEWMQARPRTSARHGCARGRSAGSSDCDG